MARCGLGRVYYSIHSVDQAVAEFDAAITANPHYHLGKVLSMLLRELAIREGCTVLTLYSTSLL